MSRIGLRGAVAIVKIQNSKVITNISLHKESWTQRIDAILMQISGGVFSSLAQPILYFFYWKIIKEKPVKQILGLKIV